MYGEEMMIYDADKLTLVLVNGERIELDVINDLPIDYYTQMRFGECFGLKCDSEGEFNFHDNFCVMGNHLTEYCIPHDKILYVCMTYKKKPYDVECVNGEVGN